MIRARPDSDRLGVPPNRGDFRHEIGTESCALPRYRRGMDEVTAVLERLARIEALDAVGAPARDLLTELRALVGEAEAWSRVEGGDRSESAVERLRSVLARDMIGV